jgi:adenylate kinase family enzyme
VRRAVILGPGGSGKSELARELGRRTGLPVTHLDVLFWGPDWTPAPADAAVQDLAAVIATDRWILDGNFLEHAPADGRFERADTVIFLDLPRLTCLWRVLKRLVRDRRRARPDLPAGSSESFDPEGLRWIWRYGRRDRPQVLALLRGLDPTVTVHHVRTRSEVRRLVGAAPAA